MKKLFSMVFALMMLVSCDQKDITPPEVDTAKSQSLQPAENQYLQEIETDESLLFEEEKKEKDLFSSIVRGEKSTVIYSELSPEKKQELLEYAARDNVAVDFGSDGSTSFTFEDGTILIQQKDDSTIILEASGIIAQIGTGVWPDNVYTRMLPTPDFGTLGCTIEQKTAFWATIIDLTVDDLVDYSRELQKMGFTNDVVSGANDPFFFSARNQEGYQVAVTFDSEMACIHLKHG